MNDAEPTALGIFLHGEQAGTLERLPQAKLRFAYAGDWATTSETPLSLSLPIEVGEFDDAACAPYFEGLLPEGNFLRAIARTFHVSAENPFALLAEIGGECAGAVAVGPDGGPAPGTAAKEPKWLSEAELIGLLDELPERPLALLDLVDEGEGIRVSLAGAHDKAGVLCEGGTVGLTLGTPPSTHILKLPIARVAEPIANEAYCMKLAAAAGLDVATVEPRLVGGHEFLLVRRYDRNSEIPPDGRLHQEDFCQALAIGPSEKYESEGGPGVRACAALLREASAAPARDLVAFLDALLFNFLVGNNDAHGKNYSLMLEGPGATRLAPLYDLLCTIVFPDPPKKLAMRYGGENRPKYLRRRHLERLADELEVRPRLVFERSRRLVETVAAASEAARSALPEGFRERPVLDEIDAAIAGRRERLATALDEPADAS